MAMVEFLYGTKAEYEALVTKDMNTLYFLTDTLQIMKGDAAYTEKVIVKPELPTSGIQGVLYVKSADKSLHYWDGAAFNQINVKLATEITDASDDSTAVTPKAVKTYVDGQISELSADAVKAVSYDNATHALSVTTGAEAAVSTYVAGLVTDFAYDENNANIVLTFTDAAGASATKSVSIPKEQVLTGVVQHTVTADEAGKADTIYADAEEGEIGLLLTVTNLVDNSNVQYFVGLSNFIDVYTSGSADSDPVKIAVDQDTNKITASIALDENEFEVVNGKVTVKAIAASKITGLDAAITSKMDKMDAAATADTIILGTGVDNKVKGSVYTIGGTTADAFGVANAVATEVGAKAYADKVADDTLKSAKAYTNEEIQKLDADLDATGTAEKDGVFVVSGVTQVDGVVTAVDSVEVEKAGAAAAAKVELIGSDADGKDADTIKGAKAYADAAVAAADEAASEEIAKKMTKKAGTANTVILGDAEGEAVRSEYAIGAGVIDETATENKLATEAAVVEALTWKTIA